MGVGVSDNKSLNFLEKTGVHLKIASFIPTCNSCSTIVIYIKIAMYLL